MQGSSGAISKLVGLLSIAIILALLIAGWMWFKADRTEPANITTFEECVGAGYQVAESYPRQCYLPDGRVIVEDIDPSQVRGYSEYTSPKGEVIRMKSPLAEQEVKSPMIISGEVRGSWSFEADFPVEVVDANGKTVAEGHATLDGDWMTEDYVPFQASLEFTAPGTDSGLLILRKDNPSGLPRNDDAVEIPIRFRSEN
jgi:hypothetical protein